MTDFIIKKLPYDLSSHAGLALIGKYLKRININSLIDPAFPVRSGVANSAILKSYLALLCLGKNDFEAIENFRDNAFFMRALGLSCVPSSPTLRQRLDTHAASWFDLAAQLNHKLLSSTVNGLSVDFGALECGYTPVDLDTFAMDNSATKKELVGRTYAGVDGYCPFAVYLGSLGYCLELALRPGVQHSAAESQYNFERALPMAASLVSGSMLVRADSGFDSLKLFREITAQADALGREIAFIIKWNPRRAPVEAIAGVKVADSGTQWVIHRPGKRECIWQESLDLTGVGSETNPARRVYRLTERTIDKHGVVLLLPEYVLEGWTTTLPQRFEAFGMGATFGGVSGVLFASFQGFISPESFTLMESIMIAAMVVLGGLGHLPGVVLGAVILAALPEVLRHVAGPLQHMTGGRLDASILRQLLIALAMIGIMLWRPRGLWPTPEHGKSLLQAK